MNVNEDYQISSRFLAEVKLLEFYREGERFILDDKAPDNKLITYGTQYWRCEILKSTYYPVGMRKIFPFKYIYSQGVISPSNANQKHRDIEENVDEYLDDSGSVKKYTIYTKQDRFLMFDGTELY